MSKSLPARPRIASRAKRRFALVVSAYNAKYTAALEKNARAELLAIHPDAEVETHSAPGSFEIPILVKKLVKSSNTAPRAVIALGVVIEGETAHAALIAASVTQALQQLAIAHEVPIIHEVLLVKNEAQARARCLGAKLNRGREAARAAAAVAETIRTITPF